MKFHEEKRINLKDLHAPVPQFYQHVPSGYWVQMTRITNGFNKVITSWPFTEQGKEQGSDILNRCVTFQNNIKYTSLYRVHVLIWWSCSGVSQKTDMNIFRCHACIIRLLLLFMWRSVYVCVWVVLVVMWGDIREICKDKTWYSWVCCYGKIINNEVVFQQISNLGCITTNHRTKEGGERKWGHCHYCLDNAHPWIRGRSFWRSTEGRCVFTWLLSSNINNLSPESMTPHLMHQIWKNAPCHFTKKLERKV